MIRTLAAALATTTCIVALATPAAAQTREYNIPAGSLKAALDAYVRQSGRQVVYRADEVRSARSPGARGALSAEAALANLLAGSGFTTRVDGNLVAIVKVGNAPTSPDNVASSGEENADGDSDAEIIVTGSLIRGAEPASRVSTYTRDEISNQGFSTLRDFVQKLPENFAGGANQYTFGTFAGGSGDSNNSVGATSINLRGLGNEATLILLNGQRLAPASQKGNFIDISMIPLSAIDRVDILPDGASATYGSDAVGGVVNLSLRDNFDGAETGVRVGTTTRGGRDEVRANVALGKSWADGGILAAYEFARETEVKAEDRAFARDDVGRPFWLLPRTRSHSILVSGHQDLDDATEFRANALYTKKNSEQRASLPGFSSNGINEIEQLFIGAGLSRKLGSKLTLDLNSSYSRNTTNQDSFDLLTQAQTQAGVFKTRVLSVDLKLSGTLFDMLAGPVTFAAGGHYRNEHYLNFFQPDPLFKTYKADRNVKAAFAEVHAPVIGNALGGSRSLLELVAADRYETYSDFGSTNDFKMGAIFRPTDRLVAKVSYGTSFVAPLLADLNPIPYQVAALPGAFFDDFGGATGAPDTLALFGGNPDLQPQTSKDFSAGVEFQRRGADGPAAYAGYYNIRYHNKISSLAGLLPNYFEIYTRQDDFGPGVLRFNPSPAEITGLASLPTFTSFLSGDLSTIGAILDSRQRNLANLETSGIDFGASYALSGSWGRNESGLSATYILKYRVSTSSTASFSPLNTAYNPVDLRFRAYNTLQVGRFSGSIFWNYIDSYFASSQRQDKVPSWSTFDVNLAYDLNDAAGPLSGLRVSFGINNLTDKAPPRIPGAINILFYDAANANPLGRVVYLDVRKRF